MNPWLAFLLSPIFEEGALALKHRADLERSGITEASRVAQGIRSIPPGPDMMRGLLGFNPPAMQSAMLFPFPDPAGGYMDYVRMKLIPSVRKIRREVDVRRRDGTVGRARRVQYVLESDLQPDDEPLGTIKYLQPTGSEPRLYFVRSVLPLVMDAAVPLYLIEGEKKAIAGAQLGLAAIGFSGIHGWHVRGSRALLADFAPIPLGGRVVEVVADGDVATNRAVENGAADFGEALERAGARVHIKLLPVAA